MQLTEKDIFNYVFYPELISKEKKEFLMNSQDFNNEIEFYSSLKDSLIDELPIEVKQKLASRIDSYKHLDIIYLYPVEEHFAQRKSNNLVLAAASDRRSWRGAALKAPLARALPTMCAARPYARAGTTGHA